MHLWLRLTNFVVIYVESVMSEPLPKAAGSFSPNSNVCSFKAK
jgi:hypothetical protein